MKQFNILKAILLHRNAVHFRMSWTTGGARQSNNNMEHFFWIAAILSMIVYVIFRAVLLSAEMHGYFQTGYRNY
jgi:hypothetical protein